ncbi:hypothetical protein BD414DRAFT_319106 [Trametes punicea]|nr:hypothetical protein BD414DRAFT_319106 [Trametes punicea]
MGQYWRLLNIDRKAIYGLYKFGEWFPYETSYSLDTVLRLPCLPPEIDKWCKKASRVVQHGPLSRLPAELVNMIFSELRPKEMACLAITCTAMLEHSKPHLLRFYTEVHASWARVRLICLGQTTHHPPGLLTEAEEAEIAETDLSYAYGNDEDHPCLSLFSSEVYEDLLGIGSRWPREIKEIKYGLYRWIEEEGRRAGTNGKHYSARRAKRDLTMLRTLFWPRATYPPGARVLCNLSKGVYVREDTLGVGKRNPATLAHVLAVQICWSDDPSFALVIDDEHAERMMRGEWAGDRFCIVTLGTMPRLGGDRQWRDVTEDVRPLLEHLWKENEYDSTNF